jgi:DNA-binding transcriptional LysR family regulator
MQLPDLTVFATVAAERSFSRAAKRLHRTQPAVSQAIRRLEEELGDRLFDRSSRDGTLTEAGRLLQDYAGRLLRMAADAAVAVRELQQVRRGRVVIGANEAAVHSLLPAIGRFAAAHPQVHVEVRRVLSRQMAAALLDRSLDFGVLTFQPPEKALQAVSLGHDELVMLAPPDHRLASRRRVTMEAVGRETVIAHNDPSPARERVLRLYERRHAPINIQIALPSLDGIKRAVEMGLGVAVLPRRCALAEIASGRLTAVKVPELASPRQIRLVFRRGAELSHAAQAFLETAAESQSA